MVCVCARFRIVLSFLSLVDIVLSSWRPCTGTRRQRRANNSASKIVCGKGMAIMEFRLTFSVGTLINFALILLRIFDASVNSAFDTSAGQFRLEFV